MHQYQDETLQYFQEVDAGLLTHKIWQQLHFSWYMLENLQIY